MYNLIKSLEISQSPIVIALLIILAYFLIALIIDLFLNKVIKRLVSKTKTTFDDYFVSAIRLPIFVSIFLTGIIISFDIIKLPKSDISLYKSIINTLLVLFWGIAAFRIIKNFVDKGINKVFEFAGLQRDIIPLLVVIIRIIVILASIMTILAVWKIDITPFLASAGIVSIIIALAAKDTFANLFGGISLFLDKPFKIGDYIELDDKDRGEVVFIGARSTRIKTRDDILITIPNSIIANSKIVNESAPVRNFRVRVPVSISYDSDIDRVEQILIDLAKQNENVLPDPAPRVRFRAFGDSSLNLELLCWAHEPAIRGLTIHQLNKAIYKKFKEEGIQIPFNQLDVHLKNNS
ncbi:MAG: mechanosensitive ion channel [Candidatus Kapabacteria bacterium]|nr:mechanosensitive ion channel [Candidatus Kapabacteria bacterium]